MIATVPIRPADGGTIRARRRPLAPSDAHDPQPKAKRQPAFPNRRDPAYPNLKGKFMSGTLFAAGFVPEAAGVVVPACGSGYRELAFRPLAIAMDELVDPADPEHDAGVGAC